MSVAPEIIVPHVPRIEPVRNVRSTLLQSSLKALTAGGHLEHWKERVDPRYRERMLSLIAPEWVPVEMGMAHYAACDALQLSTDQLVQLGEATGQQINGVLLATLIRTARGAGVTPWLGAPQFGRLYARVVQGGSTQTTKLGPKDALLEFKGLCLARSSYFRHAYCGFVTACLKLLAARSPQVNIVRWDASKDDLQVRAAWV